MNTMLTAAAYRPNRYVYRFNRYVRRFVRRECALVLCAFALCAFALCAFALCALAACGNPMDGNGALGEPVGNGGEVAFSINLGGNTRAVYPPDDAMKARMDFTLTMTGGGATLTFTARGTDVIRGRAKPANYQATVTAVLDGALYAKGSRTMDIKAGAENFFPFDLKDAQAAPPPVPPALPAPVAPAISGQPQGANYTVNAIPVPLTVTATAQGGGALNYQWYSNSSASSSGGTAISGEIGQSYTPLTTTTGTVYYYVVVTDPANGLFTTSNTAAIVVVNPPVNAATPAIVTDPAGPVSYSTTAIVTPLTVVATVSDSGTRSYQWYANTSNNNTGGTAITSATSNHYTPLLTGTIPGTTIDPAGTVYYYVIVTNTISDNGDGGTKTATAASNTAEVSRLYTWNTPASITAGGVTASVSYNKASPQVSGTSVTLTLSVNGTSTLVNFSYSLSSGTLSGIYRSGNFSDASGTVYSSQNISSATFTVPTQDVTDITLTFSAY